MKQLLVVLSLLTVALSAPYASSAEVSQPIPQAPICYVKMDTIKGESMAQQFREFIEGFRFTYGVSNQSSHAGSAAGSGRPVQEPITITKLLGPSTPPLYKTLATGAIIPKAEIHFPFNTAKGIEPFYILKLAEVRILSIKQFIEGGRIFEDISFLPAKTELHIWGRKPDGSRDQEITSGYDFKAGKAN